ncbi:hypothetical protein ACFQ1M_16575 [Sungkyunkwania multivorans]|uniref:Host attachment protein n=1 Tax=Sungkyunkwania multivorans TaxID=1173618 RepID=A0ABW3D187_9FLAO
MKNVGIWIDKEKAHLVFLENKKETLVTVEAEVLYDGSRPKTDWGHTEVLKDRVQLERENKRLKDYFGQIVGHLQDVDGIAIFGPAETFFKLKDTLDKNYKDLAKKVKTAQKADSMTSNQIKAMVRTYFEENG